MKTMTKAYVVSPIAVQVEEDYPFTEHIVNVEHSTTAPCSVVTWQFPNHQFVQLLFYTPNYAEIFTASPALVLPDEGDDGCFYTQGEIQLYLSRIKSHES